MTTSEKYISRCIQISQNGTSLAAPNPSVGAVLVYKDVIIGEGFTAAFGGAHAEVNCINAVSKKNQKYISKSTLYVSLEPCSHQGKTPACSILILEKEIKHVVVGSLDPNPLVAGNGIKMLQKKGVKVEIGVLETDCRLSNKRFYTFHEKKRPYIILKWAETESGYFSPLDNSQFWISNSFSKQLVHKWRSEEMSILVGTQTAKADNPKLNVREYSGKNPTRILIDKDLNLSEKLHFFDKTQATLIFNSIKTESKENLAFVKLNFENEIAIQILDYLYSKQINSIIIEGGLYTLNQFIKQNLWDEARILIGNNKLKKGKAAPKLEGEIIKKFSLEKDTVIYKTNTK